MFDFLLEFS
jgi:hypothetical protein